MTELPIVVSDDVVTVGGYTNQVELQLSVGATGQRGSRIFTGSVDPTSLPIGSPEWGGYTEFKPGDVYLLRDTGVLEVWEWLYALGEYTWVRTVNDIGGAGGSVVLDPDLDAIADLTGTGLARRTGVNTWTLDTAAYLTSNQTITLSGDVSGSGSTSIVTTIADDSHAHTGATISDLDAGDVTTGTFSISRIPTGSTGTTVSLGNHTHSYQPVDGDLTAIAAISGTGYLRRTGVDTWTLDTPATATWGGITGTLSSQTDLQTALNAKQDSDGDLTAIAALAGTSGFLKKTAANTWSLDTSAYITGNQTITLSGDATGSGTTAITVTVADDSHNHVISNVDNLQTTLDGKQPIDADLTAIAGLAGTSGILRKTATDTWSLDTATYLTSNQTITLSGDASGSGTTAITVTVADDSHSHTSSTISALDAGDVTTGTFNIARIPTGTTGTTVALGNHTHSYQPVDGDLTAIAALTGTGFLQRTGTDTWSLAAVGTGDVVGPSSATDNGIALFNTTTGKLIKDGLVTLTGSGTPIKVSYGSGNPTYDLNVSAPPGSIHFSSNATSGFSHGIWFKNSGTDTTGWEPVARVDNELVYGYGEIALFSDGEGGSQIEASYLRYTADTVGDLYHLYSGGEPLSLQAPYDTGEGWADRGVLYTGPLNISAVTETERISVYNDPQGDSGTLVFSVDETGKATTTLLNIPHASAPGTPANGDIWTTTAGVYARINGVTIGPFAAASGGATWGSITGTLSSQSDLNTALNGKAATNQTMYIGTQAIAINAGSGTITSLAGVTSMGSLATVGTITSGTWSATAIADNKIASALTGKTYNALTLTAAATGFTIAGGTTSKTLTVSNTLTLAGTDSSTLNIGTGGTLGTAAYTASTAYLSSSTSSAQAGYFGDIYLYDDSTPSHYLQITNSANLTATRTLSINVNDAARAVSLSGDLTVSGAASISGTHTGTSSGSNTGDQTITLTGNVTGSGTGSFAATIANDAVTYAKMQNVSAQYRVLGRISASAGDTEELTGENLVTVLGQATSKTGTGSIVFHTTPTFSGTVSTGAPGGYNSFIAGSTSNVGNSIIDGSFVANRDDHAIMYLLAQGTSGTAARIRGWVAGGTAASKTVPAASSLLLSIDARGWGGTHYVGGAAMEFSLGTGTFSDSSMPGKIQLQTVPDGSTTRQTRLTIDQNGFSTFASAANGTTLSVTNSAYNAEIHASGTGDGLMTLTANGAAGNYAYNKMRTRWGQASQNELHTGLASDGSWFVSQKTINGSSVSRDNLLNVSSGGEITFNPVNSVQINGRLIFPSTKSIRLRAGNVSTGTDEYELMGYSDGNLWLTYNNPFSTYVRDLAMFKPDGTFHLAQPGYGIEYGSAGPRHMVYSSDPSGIDVPVGSTWRQTSANSTYGNLTGLLWNKVGTGTTLGTDWLVDFEGRWITYTVTTTNVTIGTGGTVTGKYTRTGKTITCRVRLVLGTSGSFSGTVALSLPATGTSLADTVYAGNVVMRDSGVSANWGLVSIGNNATTFGIVYAAGTQPAIGNSVGSGSTPFTWGNADNFHAQFTYESA